MSPLSVGYSDLAVAAILVVLNAALTWMLDLGLSRIILIAGLRAIVRLGSKRGAVRVGAGNYGGGLGPFKFHLKDLVS